MNPEIIGGLVVTILTLSVFLGVFLSYLDKRKEKKRIARERKGIKR